MDQSILERFGLCRISSARRALIQSVRCSVCNDSPLFFDCPFAEVAVWVHLPAPHGGWPARKIVMTYKSRRIYQVWVRLSRCFRRHQPGPGVRSPYPSFDGRNLFVSQETHSICSNQSAWRRPVVLFTCHGGSVFFAFIRAVNFVGIFWKLAKIWENVFDFLQQFNHFIRLCVCVFACGSLCLLTHEFVFA